LGFEIPIKPEGAFYIYANCKKFTDDSYQFALDFLEAEGVAITPGIDFGSHEAHHMLRFAYTTSIAKMAIAMQRLDRFIKKDNYDCKTTISNRIKEQNSTGRKTIIAGCKRVHEFEYAHIANSVLIPLNQIPKRLANWIRNRKLC